MVQAEATEKIVGRKVAREPKIYEKSHSCVLLFDTFVSCMC